MRFLVEEYNRPVSLKEIASVANMSKEAFCRFFKVRTRKTFVNYLNELRIDHACQMLLQSDRAIVDIAFASGFQNLSNFNRNFIKQKGITPTAYRKEVQNKF
jgi:AraC-like DNA-binding protein